MQAASYLNEAIRMNLTQNEKCHRSFDGYEKEVNFVVATCWYNNLLKWGSIGTSEQLCNQYLGAFAIINFIFILFSSDLCYELKRYDLKAIVDAGDAVSHSNRHSYSLQSLNLF